MIARFQRDDISVCFVEDTLGDGYYIFTDSPTSQRVEHFAQYLYPMHCEMYEAQGYQPMQLCQACQGKGWRWVGVGQDGEAERDECPTCEGKGGNKCVSSL